MMFNLLTAQNTDVKPLEPPDLGSVIWVIVSLAIVIALIILLIKWLSSRNRSWGMNRSLRSHGGIAIGQNHSIQVIEIAGRIYIVGSGESITLLDKFDDPQEVSDIIESLSRKPKPEDAWGQNLLSQLADRLKNRNGRQEAEPAKEQWNSASSFQQLLQEKLSSQEKQKRQLESLLNDSTKNERLMDDEK